MNCAVVMDTENFRVLQINAVYGVGSTGRFCLEMEAGLDHLGIKCYTAYSSQGSFKPNNGFLIGRRIDHKIHALLSRIWGLQGYFSKKATIELIEYANKLKPDVVHIHNLHANYINLEALLNYLAVSNIPTVLTLHDCWFYTGKCTHYTADNCYKWKESCGSCPRLHKDNTSWFFDRTSRMLSDKNRWFAQIPRLAVIGVSDWITGQAKQSILRGANEISRIYNWIDSDKFRPVDSGLSVRQKYGIKPDSFLMLSVASAWSNSKGLDKFLKLASVLKYDESLFLVGSLPGNTILPDNIIHLGAVHDIEELNAIYSAADLFLNFSIEESFGMVTAESLSSGTPVIVMNSTASPELVGEQCGYIADHTRFEDILKKIALVKMYGKMHFSSHCRMYAIENFNKLRLVSAYRDIYLKISQARN